MKPNPLSHKILLIAVLASLALGCAKKASSPEPTPAPPPVVIDDRGAGEDPAIALSMGKTVPFLPENRSVFGQYVKVHPIQSPSKVQITVDLTNVGNGRYAGNIQISYYDYGQWWTGNFESGTGYNQISYRDRYKGLPEAEFNQWFTLDGKRVFHGFFQDKIGAIILVIDSGIDLGDGGGITNLSGSVYFKNFALMGAFDPPMSNEKCWFLFSGPYDCRAFTNAEGVVVTTSALYPGNGYTKLGTFQGISKGDAFKD